MCTLKRPSPAEGAASFKTKRFRMRCSAAGEETQDDSDLPTWSEWRLVCEKTLLKTKSVRFIKNAKRFNPKRDENVQKRSPEARCLGMNGAVGVLVHV